MTTCVGDATMVAAYEARLTEQRLRARSIILSLPLCGLATAQVYKVSRPDGSNPGGYYDRWVELKYQGWFGKTRRRVLYYEAIASDDQSQEEVAKYATNIIAAINAV